MTSLLRAAGVAASIALAASAGTARGAPPPPAPAPFPVELVNRPVTLPRGAVEITVPLDISLSSDRVGEPIALAPSAYYGVTDAFMVGVRHARGLCLTGAAHGCPDVYGDVTVDALLRVWRGAGAEIALGSGLAVAPIDPFTIALQVRGVARWAGGPFAFALAPALDFGLDDRDAATLRTVPIAFPLATYAFGWAQEVTGNRELLSVPATVQVQVIPPLAVAAGAALLAPLDPRDGSVADYATFPAGFAVLVTPGSFDVGASLTFANTLGREKWPGTRPGEGRSLRIWAALRL